MSSSPCSSRGVVARRSHDGATGRMRWRRCAIAPSRASPGQFPGHEAGAAPAGGGTYLRTRAVPGLRPAPLRGPARSWLTAGRSRFERLVGKARPGTGTKTPQMSPDGSVRVARRKAPHLGNKVRTTKGSARRRATPLVREGEGKEGLPGASTKNAGDDACVFTRHSGARASRSPGMTENHTCCPPLMWISAPFT
jgi:hypothetical protein